MSSRALRKLQREQELQRQVDKAERAYEAQEESEDEDELNAAAEPQPRSTKPQNAFDLLEMGGDEEDSEVNDHELPSNPPDPTSTSTPVPNPSSSSKPKKKRKARAKKKGKAADEAKNEESGDEVDRALKELNAKGQASQADVAAEHVPGWNWEVEATKLLHVEERNLNPINEMKSLFGSIALEGEGSRSSPRNLRRREQNQQGGVDLATALTGRYSVASKGKELGSLASRRNIFIQGKEEWPLSTSGGLSMELVPNPQSFTKQYTIVHSNLYRETQIHFCMAVESMDPQRMIGLLSMYPYHIATLLQVSEIAKHQGDHSVSGDLLERALYSIGKSVHSSFPSSLRSGIARIAFNKPANRELYLAIWRYITNLGMRGTWRTAFEWSKILLQLDTLVDPYGVTLMIDQLALRGRQHAQLLALCADDAYGPAWAHLPNIQTSLALAYLRAGKPRESRKQLALATHRYPYIMSALASALDVSPLPKSLWAKLPSSDAEKLYTQLYVTRAKDLWNTPETISLLVEVAETLNHYPQESAPSAKLEISLEEARHIMLLEIPYLIALLPRRFTTMPTSSSDVLPPPDSESDFVRRAPGAAGGDGTMQAIFSAAGATAGATGSLLQRIMNWFQQPAGPNDTEGESDGQAALRSLQEQLGGNVPHQMIEQLLQIHLNETEEEDINPAGLGMVGGWDYYEEAADDDDEQDDSMPELEDIPVGSASLSPSTFTTADTEVSRNPHAAMVEDDDDDDDYDSTPGRNQQLASSTTTGNAILRRVDSDDSITTPAPPSSSPPPPSSTARRPILSPSAPAPRTFQPATSTSTPAETSDTDLSDPQRLQRWLLTTGLTEVQSKKTSLATYVTRLKTLRKPQQNWVVSMVRHRAGPELESQLIGTLQE
ncbi:uncharacterized protein A1O9_11095 [Exophiala aquamarina CBS 119918]|uniref:Uncharacterized protein n=1 Tax=Exophiala aquamarina CBS 119918 TaxID=1182545 RepID=A0A072P088_9EURO|nr:uncharacterized protein A1O9_11095 [Exophiala aquamarina CBS 119918]KEF52678.1 hypothetical protein A1O9_11095 [Exophiala aquamarina CBS 119918]